MKTRTWIAVLLVAVLVLAGWVVAGPWLASRALDAAIRSNDAPALGRQVDFPVLRANLKRQLAARVVRAAGPDVQASALGAFGLGLATGATSLAVDAAVNPVG